MVSGNFLRYEHKGMWEIANTPEEVMVLLDEEGRLASRSQKLCKNLILRYFCSYKQNIIYLFQITFPVKYLFFKLVLLSGRPEDPISRTEAF